MNKYLFIYHGGSKSESDSETSEIVAAWETWLTSIGKNVADPGNPVGISTTVNNDGSVVNNGGSNPASGYSLINAIGEQEAIEIAKGCPILAAGGSVELALTVEM